MKNIFLFITTFCYLALLSAIAGNIDVTVHLKNGDVITGKSTLAKVAVNTPYGALSIPTAQISTIKFGIFSDHTKDGAVLPDLSKLQTLTNIADAKTVYERLLAYGSPILSTVITYTQNPFYKMSDRENYTIEQLIDELSAKANLTADKTINDAVSFDNNNYIEGSVAFTDIQMQTEYGSLTFKREKIESMDISPSDETALSTDGSYKLKANYHISGNTDNKGWLNTGVKVKPGDKFNITATGKIVLKSLSGGVFSPDGFVSGTKDNAYTDDMSPKYGAVVYRIGQFGDAITAGSKFEGTANTEGTIYVSIYETVFDKTNTGFYTIKVTKK
ncbi:MAG TPA: hypothetical protein PKM51_01285 [Chitinophagales bacterium]|nr:hypothetical protein [Chitinophagales bacterium]HNM31354.1 hypothetical protein [Chitinophagales bacterium]